MSSDNLKQQKSSTIPQQYIQLKMKDQQTNSNIQRQIQLGLPVNMEAQANLKIDQSFFKSYQSAKDSYGVYLFYLVLKAVLLIIFMPIDYLVVKAASSQLTIFMSIGIASNTLLFILSIHFYTTCLKVMSEVLQVAKDTNHTIEELDNDNKIVSKTMYDANTGMLIGAPTEQYMKSFEKMLKTIIQNSMYERRPNYVKTQKFLKLVSFANFIFGIVALATVQPRPNTSELGVLITFLILQGLSHLLVICILVIVAFVPIVCLVCCFVMCCCKKPQEKISIPLPQNATMQMITEAGGDCSICFQSFKVEEEVICLQCSPKHMFHSLCIGAWVKMSPTCPICRKRLVQENQSQAH